jgi:predicted MFS family arabinose efflux permease
LKPDPLRPTTADKPFYHSLRFQLPAFAAVRVVFNTMARMIYPFLSIFSAGLGVGLGAMSLALTLRSLSGVAGPFLASAADSRGRKTGMLGGILLFTLGSMLLIFWSSYTTFVLALILTTIGYLIFIPAMQAYLGDRVPYGKRGLAIALTEMGWSLSFIIGVPLIGLLLARHGWLSPFPLFAALGLLALLFFARILPDDKQALREQSSLKMNFRAVFTSPLALAGLACAVLYTMANESINLVFGVWLEENFGLKITALSLVALGIGFSELGGEALVGALTDRLGKIRSAGIGLILNCLAVLILLLFGRWLSGALLGLLIFYLTFEFTLVSSIPLMSEILPSARATLMAMNIAFISLGRALGAVLSPLLYNAGLETGILFNAIGAILFNILAFLALRWIKRGLVHLD